MRKMFSKIARATKAGVWEDILNEADHWNPQVVNDVSRENFSSSLTNAEHAKHCSLRV